MNFKLAVGPDACVLSSESPAGPTVVLGRKPNLRGGIRGSTQFVSRAEEAREPLPIPAPPHWLQMPQRGEAPSSPALDRQPQAPLMLAAPREPGGSGRPLVSFPEIASRLATMHRLSPSDADIRVLDTLASAAGIGWFGCQPGTYADALPAVKAKFFVTFGMSARCAGGVLHNATADNCTVWRTAALLVDDAEAMFGFGAAGKPSVFKLQAVPAAADLAQQAKESALKALENPPTDNKALRAWAVARAKDLEAAKVGSVRDQVGKVCGVAGRTIGKWISEAKKADATTQKNAAMSKSFASLKSSNRA